MNHNFAVITIHLLAAMLAGGLIGLERSFHGRPAGFRTHALVCLASALLMTVTVFQASWINVSDTDLFRTDPTRMAQGIMTGIGFLGAGVIFKEGLNVRGLTTAASIWITAAIGILVGVGFYFPAVLATVLVLITLSLFRWIEAKIPSHYYANNTIAYERDSAPSQDDVKQFLSGYGFKLVSVSYRIPEDAVSFEYRMTIRTSDSSNLTRLAEHLRKQKNVRNFEISLTGE
jgi:putative Mg2+ transporter-C (MgtC) family protein